jgi:uncharacterized integral membrane protein
MARAELEKIGRMTWQERVMLLVFGLVAALWTTTRFHGIDYSAVALLGICILLVSNVLNWEDLLAERAAWDVFIWYGGMIRMAEALGETGITRRLAETASNFTVGWRWGFALTLLAVIYFYAHYAFASISAHALAMFVPFLLVIIGAGAPAGLAVLVPGAFFESIGWPDALWNDAGSDIFRSGVCLAAHVVAVGTGSVDSKHHYLGHCWRLVVEADWLLVVRIRETSEQTERHGKKRQRWVNGIGKESRSVSFRACSVCFVVSLQL